MSKDDYAREVLRAGRDLEITPRGIVIGYATVDVECNWIMYANTKVPESLNLPHERVGSDGKSVGLFQQQVVWGNGAWWWGDAAACMDPYRSARMFFERLKRLDYNNTSRSPGSYAQAVQQSAYPDRYDQRIDAAQQLYDRLATSNESQSPSSLEVSPMGDPVWLPDVLRDAGLEVREYPGWRDRGHGDFGSIWGVIAHHTGSFGETPRGIAEHPSLGLASQLHLDQNGVYTICGAGVAWHAGNGSWPGLPNSGANQYTIGIEAANDGGGRPGLPHRASWSDAQYEAYVRGVAAILRKLGHDSSHVIGHKEWAGAAQGKWDPGAIDMDRFRVDVQAVIDSPEFGGILMGFADKELSTEFPSRSKYRDNDKPKATPVGFLLSLDAMTHESMVERHALAGAPYAVELVRREAAKGDEGASAILAQIEKA